MGAYYSIITCRNSKKDIENAINSLVKQTIKPKYMIVIDDGSTDSTPSILINLQKKNTKSIHNHESRSRI